MISSSIHSLTPALTQSLQQFRQQVSNEPEQGVSRQQQAQQQVGQVQFENDESSPGQSVSENRDQARQTAVYAVELKQKHSLVNSYIEAASDNESEDESYVPEPVDVYKASLKYARRDELVQAFENAVERRDAVGSSLNVVI